VDEQFVTEDNKIEVSALDPLIYATTVSQYHALGKTIATAYSVGRQLMKD